jgi:histidine ammonia-lyase
LDALSVLKKKPYYQPVDLQEKEGIAFINGTQFMTATGIEALIRSERVLNNYLAIYALTFEVLGGEG